MGSPLAAAALDQLFRHARTPNDWEPTPIRPKILAAPLTVIIGHDLDFPRTMPQLFPARGEMMRGYFLQPGIAETTAFRNGSLQGAYLIMAARALGLDCGGRTIHLIDCLFLCYVRQRMDAIRRICESQTALVDSVNQFTSHAVPAHGSASGASNVDTTQIIGFQRANQK